MPPPLSPPLHLLERQKDIKLVLSSKALIDSALHNYFSSFWNGPVAWKRVELKNTEDRKTVGSEVAQEMDSRN